ncbi:adenosine deaminase [Streptomyces cavernicola]|uniref:Adenosine deaminase n=1 Tax=Streptomyces cavernicola TaxID=3043613 RepID=A0ABT6S517_9ACTN|nr:adenosine deaminase [Streptomyces sp. B-S-A6]MDI3403180.1 adenosine deaminase [Streptomyces sp. B-S-A6]
MDTETFLRRLPKGDLHLHLAGALRPATLVELARKHDVPLRTTDPQHLYNFADFYDFLDVVRAAASCIRDHGDFARVAYECLADAAQAGNLKYAEMFFNPTDYLPAGVPYRTMAEGYAEGIRQAEADLGVTGRLIPSINRELGPDTARQMLDAVLEHRIEQVIGIGMDGAERSGPPEQYAEVYQAAGRAGLRRTAHTCEDNQTLAEAPPANITTTLDALGCDRIDHGYNILGDPAVVRRCAEEDTPFTVCSHTCVPQRLTTRWKTLRTMQRAGLFMVVCTDDPPMYRTDIGTAYVTIARELAQTPAEAAQSALAALDATWLDDTDKRAQRKAFTDEIAALTIALEN